MALCQFWKAKVVRHIAQKFVMKKCSENRFWMRRAPMVVSGMASSRNSCARSAAFRPSSVASMIRWSAPISRALALGGHFWLNCQISSFTDMAGSVNVGIVSSRFHRVTYASSSSIRPPRVT